MNRPATETWQTLYGHAAALQQLAPWEWLGNEHVFAVDPPGYEERAYCSVMGAGGEEYGLVVFPGERGLAALYRLMSGVDTSSLDSIVRMRSLSTTFVDREYLEDEDLDAMQQAGADFADAGAWPLIRSVYPGYWPWYLEAWEAEYLSAVFPEAIAMAEAIRDGSADIGAALSEGNILTRHSGGDVSAEPAPELPPWQSPGMPDSDRLANIASGNARSSETWEFDAFVVPATLKEEEDDRPYPPTCIMVASDAGAIVNAAFVGPQASSDDYQELFIQVIETAERLPAALRVPRQEAQDLAARPAAALEIPVSVEETPYLDQAKAALMEEFAKEG